MYGQTVEAVVLPDAEDSRGRRLGVSYSWARSWLSAVIRRAISLTSFPLTLHTGLTDLI